MASQQAKNDKVKPPGSYRPKSERAIASLAAITPAVIADARADARRLDPELAALLEAVVVEHGRGI